YSAYSLLKNKPIKPFRNLLLCTFSACFILFCKSSSESLGTRFLSIFKEYFNERFIRPRIIINTPIIMNAISKINKIFSNIITTHRIIYLFLFNIFILSSFLIVFGAFTPMGVKNLCEFFYAFPPHFDNFCFGFCLVKFYYFFIVGHSGLLLCKMELWKKVQYGIKLTLLVARLLLKHASRLSIETIYS